MLKDLTFEPLPESAFVRARSENGVAYRRFPGPERAPKLILFHGGAGAWTHWQCNVLPLSTQFDVYAIDSPSYGDSVTVPRDIEPDVYLGMLVGCVDQICADDRQVHLAGFSFGGLVAASVACALTGRPGVQPAALSVLGSAGFAGPAGRTLNLESRKKMAADLGRSPSNDELREMHRRNLGKLMIWDTSKITDEVITMQLVNVERTRFDSRRLSWSGRMPEFAMGISCPVQVIYGEHDITTHPSFDERISLCRSVFPDGQIDVINDCGHWTMYEAADETNRLLMDFHGRAVEDAS